MRDKIYRFMQGRYGTDDFYKFLFWVALIGIVINWFFKSQLLSFAVTLILVYAMYRVLSKNHSARYAENQRYLQATAKIRYWFDQQKKLMEERKYHHIYTCPKCRQKIRIPKGKGKIMIRCPKCHHEFQKRS
ncbi:MAG: hypothetical protein SO020_03580 [Lachnospiraceae bacterium]|mgnify:FL=1|uniref:Zinc-ribbon domain-containing protein n=1 Tax=Hominiventricola filiformis TaxID=2885352 RepID=A0AAE3D9D3_9FIRM|nr:hypothetical protein [Hominiventricola filiformis]MCI6880250.1 zinc-ribbon domain-containing protein [Clostridiaceae bacterium]MDY3825615.1 hypothetical protein [Lachnospiraceae bacterium]QUO22194.1 hypothetical protein KFE18_00925 [Clostridiaceae bacterium Marseille-Q4143]RHU85856.1 hypothetical protein DXC26_01360 [Clostridiaceae bacterium OM08-6BH]MCC2124657.1 zinc-ribbon domain-containing protein [Hominiventricola filiformis]